MPNNPNKSQKKDRKTKLAALFIMCISVIVYICIEAAAKIDISSPVISASKTTLLGTTVSMEYGIDSNSIFHTHENGLFHITKDGVKYQTSDGQSKYDFAYTMSSAPIIVADEGVIAVSEPKSRNLYVFSHEGSLYTKQMTNMILTFSVNKNGYTSVITQDGEDYRLDVFTDKGAPLRSGTLANYNVFPVSTDISDDNRILAISFINVNEININSNVVFSFINSSESINYADGIFANKTLDDQFVGIIRFCDNNTISMISDIEITVGRIDSNDKYVEEWSKQVENEISKVSFNGNKGFAVAYGEPLINKDGIVPDTVELYNYSGETVFSYSTGSKITYLSASQSSVIVGSNRNFTAYGRRSVLWTYNATQDVKQLLFLGSTNSVLYVANDGAIVMRLGREQQ